MLHVFQQVDKFLLRGILFRNEQLRDRLLSGTFSIQVGFKGDKVIIKIELFLQKTNFYLYNLQITDCLLLKE
ncbi:hypothetical protein GCM10027043_40620 [Ferruginibacter profundus]